MADRRETPQTDPHTLTVAALLDEHHTATAIETLAREMGQVKEVLVLIQRDIEPVLKLFAAEREAEQTARAKERADAIVAAERDANAQKAEDAAGKLARTQATTRAWQVATALLVAAGAATTAWQMVQPAPPPTTTVIQGVAP